MTDFPTLLYTSICEILTLLNPWSLKKAPLSGRASPYRPLWGVHPPPPGLISSRFVSLHSLPHNMEEDKQPDCQSGWKSSLQQHRRKHWLKVQLHVMSKNARILLTVQWNSSNDLGAWATSWSFKSFPNSPNLHECFYNLVRWGENTVSSRKQRTTKQATVAIH